MKLWLFVQVAWAGQTPAELVARVTSYSQPLAVGTCGSFYAEQQPRIEAARALVAIGEPALPEINRAIASSTASGSIYVKRHFALNAKWLVIADAAIRRARAYPNLRAMMADPNTAFTQISSCGFRSDSIRLNGIRRQ